METKDKVVDLETLKASQDFVNNKVVDLKSATAVYSSISSSGEYVFSSSDFEQGYWNFSSPGTDQSLIPKRIRNKTFLFVKKGMKIYYQCPTMQIYIGILPTPTTGIDPGYSQVKTWQAVGASGFLEVLSDGYLVLQFNSSSDITPENYDSLVSISAEHSVGIVENTSEIYASLANDGEYTIKPSDLESGVWSWCVKTNSLSRVRTKFLIPVRKGMIFEADSQNYEIYFGVLSTMTSVWSYAQGGEWLTNSYYKNTINVDGYLIINIRNRSNPSASIDPASFDGSIKLRTALNFQDVEAIKSRTESNGSQIQNISGTLGQIIASQSFDPSELNSMFIVKDDTIDDDNDGNPLLDENGELLLGGCLQLNDSSAFVPENYVYNSGTGGYNQYIATPILYIDGDMAGMTKDKKAKDLLARFKDIRCGCSCKWQGASSVAYPKKNYTVTFDAPVLISKKWGSKTKYVLKSEFADNTHTRNTISARLWAEIVRDRELVNGATILEDEAGNPITTEAGNQTIEIVSSNILGAPGCGSTDGFHVMLVMNNKYMGLYTMGIPKDDWMFGMDNGSQNCCVLNAETNCDPTKFKATTTESDIDDEKTFTVEYASDDMTLSRITTSINNAITAIKNASGDNYRSAIETYFDVDSAIDYTIFSLLIGNWDGISHNFNLATYNGVKWMFSAYDLDNTFGMEDLVAWDYNNPYDSPLDVRPNLPFSSDDSKLFYLVLTNDKETFKNRYNHLRNTVLSESNVFTKFYNFISCVSKRVFAEELTVWPTTPRTGAQTVDAIINFYRLRCQHIDSAVSAL